MDADILWPFGVTRKGEQWERDLFIYSFQMVGAFNIGLNGGNMNKKIKLKAIIPHGLIFFVEEDR